MASLPPEPNTSASPADAWKHSPVFDEGNPAAERNTRRVVILTAAMMVAEIIAGVMFNSMALLADGLHMSPHATARGLSALAYIIARKFAQNPRFAFGTWKMEVLGGYTSAVLPRSEVGAPSVRQPIT